MSDWAEQMCAAKEAIEERELADHHEMQDKLEALSRENEALKAAALDGAASLAAAISLLANGGKKAAASDKMFDIMLNDYNKSLEHLRAALSHPTTEKKELRS